MWRITSEEVDNLPESQKTNRDTCFFKVSQEQRTMEGNVIQAQTEAIRSSQQSMAKLSSRITSTKILVDTAGYSG